MNLTIQKRIQQLLRSRHLTGEPPPSLSADGRNPDIDIARRIAFCIFLGTREEATEAEIDIAARLSHALDPFPILGPKSSLGLPETGSG